jgi:hypothetical protein
MELVTHAAPLLHEDAPRSDVESQVKRVTLQRPGSVAQLVACTSVGPRKMLQAAQKLWADYQTLIKCVLVWSAALLFVASALLLFDVPRSIRPWCTNQTASHQLACIWFDGECLLATPNGTATAEAFVTLTTEGLAFDEAVATAVSTMALYAFAQFGGIPVPDTRFGTRLWAAWMTVQALQWAVMFASLVMVVLAYANAMHTLDGCLRGDRATRLSLVLSALVTPSTTSLAMMLFLYAFALSTGYKVWLTAVANPAVHERTAFVLALKRTKQSTPYASSHFWIGYCMMIASSAVFLLAASWAFGIVALPVCVALIGTIKGVFWLVALLTRQAMRIPISGVGESVAALIGWIGRLHRSSFAPGGFRVHSAFTSGPPMCRHVDDPGWGTLGRTLNIFFVLIAIAPAVCLGVWIAIPTVAGAVPLDEAFHVAFAVVGEWILAGLTAIFTLTARWSALLSLELITQALDDLGGFVRQAWESLAQLAWYLNLDLAALIEGARHMMVLNSLLALIKPAITGVAKASLVVSRLLTQTTDPGFVGAVSFAECVPSEREDLCAAVGARPDELGSLLEADWSKKRLDAEQAIVVARILIADDGAARLTVVGRPSHSGTQPTSPPAFFCSRPDRIRYSACVVEPVLQPPHTRQNGYGRRHRNRRRPEGQCLVDSDQHPEQPS